MKPVPDPYWELANVEAHLVQRLGTMPRTKLVKLVYLIDERFFQLYGRTLTGMSYVYDDYGPNAVDNLIVRVGDMLNGHELLIEESVTKKGVRWYAYRTGPSPRFDPGFPPEATHTIDEIVGECGRLPVEEIVAVAKKTRPFRSNPVQGSRLEMVTLRQDASRRLDDLRRAAALLRPPAEDDQIGHQESIDSPIGRSQTFSS